MSRNLRSRLEKLEGMAPPPAQSNRRLDQIIAECLGLPPGATDSFEQLLNRLGEEEVDILDVALNRSIDNGFDDQRRHDDAEFVDLIHEMAGRIRARCQLPSELQPYLRKGSELGEVWTLEGEIDFVRRGIAQDFSLSGISADLSSATLDDLLVLVKLRVGGAGIVAVGWTLAGVEKDAAEEVCRRIGVDVFKLPGVEEEIAGLPLTWDKLYANWKRRVRALDYDSLLAPIVNEQQGNHP